MTHASQPQPRSLRVALPSDIQHVADAAKDLSVSLGFQPEQYEQIHLVVTELASNLIRHASHGTIRISSVHSDDRVGIQIESDDDGPGIPNVEQAMTDGYSTCDGLGLGLGTINRLMDDLEFSSGANGGLHIVCHRWLRPRPPGLQKKDIMFGVATRSRRMDPDNGDAFIVRHWDGNSLGGVIDGLGHGELARRASLTARQYIEQHYDQPFDKIFRGTDRACRATRGVVMALARFDFTRKKLIVADVGNIEMRLIGSAERFNPIIRRGVIGLNAPGPVVTEHPWSSSCLLVMHSDGLRTNWNWNDFRYLSGEPPDIIARRLLTALGTLDDDATVLVARSVPA
jgi:anti-sigma regulatory factor (Ser/Thr protein kinase)/serine/threonine protein phosphatase PrpC